jgi:hypothetical protein
MAYWRFPNVVVIALALLAPLPSMAQAQTPAGALSLRSQSAWRLPDEPFTLGLGIQAPNPEGLELAVSVYRRLPTRSDFALTLEGRLAGRPATEVPPIAVTDLGVDANGDRSFSFDPDMTREGVYPLKVELRPLGGGKAVDSFVTYLTNVGATIEGPKLDVALVVPVHAPPAIQPDGHTAIDDQRAQELAGLVASLAGAPDVPLTLVPTPETTEALAASARDEDKATASALVDIVGRDPTTSEVLGGPYVSTNLAAMVAGGLDGEQAAQLARGTSTLSGLLRTTPTTTTRLVEDRLDEAALAALQDERAPVTRIVVPEPLLEPVARDTTLAAPFDVEGRRGRVAAVMADAGLTAHFGGRDPVLAAYRLLADLAVLYFDHPGEARGVVATPPATWQPSGVLAKHVLAGLTNNPILGPVTVDRLFADVPPATGPTPPRSTPNASRTLVRRFAPLPAGTAPPTMPGPSIRAARSRIESFASALDPANPVLDTLDRTLLASEANDLRARERTLYLTGVQNQIGAQVDKIAMPQNRSITLTAREGEIPVTVTSTLSYPVKAVLRFSSDTLEFPHGDSAVLELNRRNTTTRITVRAQSSGSFPLRVSLETPDGNLVIAESRFTVRSTAISGVGTALSIGALLFLLVWWGNHLRGRRSRKLVPAG